MKPVFYHIKARQDLDDAALYYEQQRVGLGEIFESIILETEDLLSRNPKIGPLLSLGNTDIRKYPLQRFPFTLFYSETAERIYVYAIAHDSRKPGHWEKRIDSVQND